MYPKFGKIPRLNRAAMITEKIDGTNGLVAVYGPDEQVPEDATGVGVYGEYFVAAGSRNRWITPTQDNHGFAAWVWEHAGELAQLGPGFHHGEWHGKGIQRGYGLPDKRFALFNVRRYAETRPACCGVVPVLGVAETDLSLAVGRALADLTLNGSRLNPGFKPAEGVVIFHTAAGQYFKATIEGDAAPKSLAKEPDAIRPGYLPGADGFWRDVRTFAELGRAA